MSDACVMVNVGVDDNHFLFGYGLALGFWEAT